MKVKRLVFLTAVVLSLASGCWSGRQQGTALEYDFGTFYSADKEKFYECIVTEENASKLYVSLDGGRGIQASNLAVSDFAEIGDAMSSENGVSCGRTRIQFQDNKVRLMIFGATKHVTISSRLEGPFLRLEASREEVEKVFGKPIREKAFQVATP